MASSWRHIVTGRGSEADAVSVWETPDPTHIRSTAAEQSNAPTVMQLACLSALAERLAAVIDLDMVLDVVADAVMTALAPAACAIDILDDEGSGLAISLTRGLDSACADWWLETGSRTLPRPEHPQLLAPSWPANLQPQAPPALLWAPLVVPGQAPVGSLALFAPHAKHIPALDSPVLRNITIQAAAAVASSRARLREVLAVYSVAQSVTGRIHLGPLASSVLRAVASLFKTNEGAIVLAESQSPGHTGLQVIAQLGDTLTPPAAETLLEICTRRMGPFVLERLAPLSMGEPGLFGEGLAAPLQLERKLLGVMLLTYPAARSFRQSDLWLLSAIATQITMALRNAQLYLWSEELAIAEERSRIAREIHDGLAQSLAHKILKLDLCQKLIDRDPERLRKELEELKHSIRTDIQDVRHSILALRPLDLEQRGLHEAVQAYVSQFSHDTAITITARIASLEHVSPKVQTALFRLIQESLNNIRKHAQATSAAVIIQVEDAGQITLQVTDNGCGFDVDTTLARPPGHSGVGLRGMIERSVGAGGTISIISKPGQGTTLSVRLPES